MEISIEYSLEIMNAEMSERNGKMNMIMIIGIDGGKQKEQFKRGDGGTGVVFGNVPLQTRWNLYAWDSKKKMKQGHVYLD